MGCNTGKIINPGSIYQSLQGLKDEHKALGKRYALATELIGILLAKLCREDKPSGIAEWVKHRQKWIVHLLGLKWEQMPHHNTYRRVLAQGVKADELERMVRERYRQEGQIRISPSSLLRVVSSPLIQTWLLTLFFNFEKAVSFPIPATLQNCARVVQ